MSLSKRLAAMGRRLQELEQWKGAVEQALEDEEQEEAPDVDLDGNELGAERDQTQSLG